MGRSPSPVRRRDDKREERRDVRDDRRERDDRRDRFRRPHRSRSRSRSKERRRRGSGDRPGRRSSSPARRRRSRSSSPGTSKGKGRKSSLHDRPAVTQADLEGKSPEEQEMLRVMGFCGFDTTKGKKVDENDLGDVHVVLKRKYRQYMNRKGGFNRPLDFVA